VKAAALTRANRFRGAVRKKLFASTHEFLDFIAASRRFAVARAISALFSVS
jgi:hypothetical protein